MKNVFCVILLSIIYITTLPISSEAQSIMHVVKKGECLSVIGQYYDVKWPAIALVNRITKKPYIIHPGQIIRIPTENIVVQYKIKKGDTIPQIAKTFNIKARAIYSLNKLSVNKFLKHGESIKIILKKSILIHRIEKDETLCAIGKKYNVSISEIREINNIKNRDLIYQGNILVLYKSKHTQQNYVKQYYLNENGGTLFVSKKIKIEELY